MKVFALPVRVLPLGTYVVVKPIEAEKAEGVYHRSRWMNAAAGPKDRAKAGNKTKTQETEEPRKGTER